MLHRQNRQNDRGPDEATTELGALEQGCEWTWTMVPSLLIPLRSETIDVDSIRQGRVCWTATTAFYDNTGIPGGE